MVPACHVIHLSQNGRRPSFTDPRIQNLNPVEHETRDKPEGVLLPPAVVIHVIPPGTMAQYSDKTQIRLTKPSRNLR